VPGDIQYHHYQHSKEQENNKSYSSSLWWNISQGVVHDFTFTDLPDSHIGVYGLGRP
jgi:hypothetical protein